MTGLDAVINIMHEFNLPAKKSRKKEKKTNFGPRLSVYYEAYPEDFVQIDKDLSKLQVKYQSLFHKAVEKYFEKYHA